MRRRLLLLTGVAVLAVCAAAGCTRFAGPVETRDLGRADPRDEKGRPLYSIPEQQKRGRERLAITEDDWRIGPRGYSDRPTPLGR